jgi:hypothetical protein
MAVSGGPGMMLHAFVVESLAATLGVEAIDALLARRRSAPVSGQISWAPSCSS